MNRRVALLITLLFSALPFTTPPTAQACTIAAGQTAFNAGQYGEAFDIFVCVHESGTDEEQAALGIGRAALMLDAYSTAANVAVWASDAVNVSQKDYSVQQIDRLTRALAKDPDNVPLMTQLAHWLWLRARDEEAMPLYESILKADPQSVFAHTFRASSQAYLGDLDAADADFAQAFELAPDNDHVYAIAAITYRDVGDPELAVDYASQAIALQPDEFAGRYVTRGDAYFDLGDYEAAAADYEEALSLDQDNFDALAGLANSLLVTGQYKEAFSPVNQALGLRPDSGWALIIRGYLYLNTDELELSAADFERALELYPEYADALGGLGDLAYFATDYEEAVAYYERAIASEPSWRYARGGLAAALSGLNDPGAAQATADLFQTANNQLELAAVGKPQVLPIDFNTVYVTTIEANAGDTISASAASVEAGALNPVIVILDNNGEAAAFSDDVEGFDAVLDAFVVTRPGTYTVLIGLLDAVSGEARIGVRLTPAG